MCVPVCVKYLLPLLFFPLTGVHVVYSELRILFGILFSTNICGYQATNIHVKGKNLMLTHRLPFGETIWVLILNPSRKKKIKIPL